MKGDGSIKIKLKFIGVGYLNNYQVNVKVYSKNGIIYDGYTYNGSLELNLKPNEIYRIEASFLSQRIITNIYTNQYEYVFIVNGITVSTPIIFTLRDYYYNLPIEKGVLNLWRNQ